MLSVPSDGIIAISVSYDTIEYISVTSFRYLPFWWIFHEDVRKPFLSGFVYHIDKLDLLATYPHARTGAFKTNTIQTAFKATNIVPLDAEPVLFKLSIQLRTPTPVVERLSSRLSVYWPKIPANVKQLIKHKVSTKRLIEYRSFTTPHVWEIV